MTWAGLRGTVEVRVQMGTRKLGHLPASIDASIHDIWGWKGGLTVSELKKKDLKTFISLILYWSMLCQGQRWELNSTQVIYLGVRHLTN